MGRIRQILRIGVSINVAETLVHVVYRPWSTKVLETICLATMVMGIIFGLLDVAHHMIQVTRVLFTPLPFQSNIS